MATHTPVDLSQIPAFGELVSLGTGLATTHAHRIADLDVDERHTYMKKAEALGADISSGVVGRREDAVVGLSSLLGMTEADLRALALRAQVNAAALREAFPDLLSMPERERVDRLIDVIRHEPAVIRAAEDIARSHADAESPQACEAVCIAFYLTFLAASIAMLVILVLGCVGLSLIPPLMILCIIAAIAFASSIMTIATIILNNCLEHCRQGEG